MARKENYSLEMDLGFKTIEIKFPAVDDVVQIQFNPADIGLAERMLKARTMMEENVNLYEEETGDLREDEAATKTIELISSLNEKMCEVVDYAFGNKVSDKVFKHCAPMAIVNGEYFIISFFEKIAPVIVQIQKVEIDKADKKTEKYLKKYANKSDMEFAKKIGGLK